MTVVRADDRHVVLSHPVRRIGVYCGESFHTGCARAPRFHPPCPNEKRITGADVESALRHVLLYVGAHDSVWLGRAPDHEIGDQIQTVFGAVYRLEEMADMRELATLLVPDGRSRP